MQCSSHFETSEKEDEEGEDDSDEARKEMEIALYSQIHHDANDEADVCSDSVYLFQLYEAVNEEKTEKSDELTKRNEKSSSIKKVSSKLKISEVCDLNKSVNFSPIDESIDTKLGIKTEAKVVFPGEYDGRDDEYIDTKLGIKTETKDVFPGEYDGRDVESIDTKLRIQVKTEAKETYAVEYEGKDVVEISSESESDGDVVYALSDESDDMDELDSDCMMLDEDLSDLEGVKFNIEDCQKKLLKKRSSGRYKCTGSVMICSMFIVFVGTGYMYLVYTIFCLLAILFCFLENCWIF